MIVRQGGRLALMLTVVALLPGKVVWGETAASRKLDHSLQKTVSGGCSGVSLPVIIRVEDGQGKRMRDSLSSHGRKVRADFAYIDALAADVNCDDLPSLASMSAVSSISLEAPMQAHAKPSTLLGRSGGNSGRGRSPKKNSLSQSQAAARLQASFFESMSHGRSSVRPVILAPQPRRPTPASAAP